MSELGPEQFAESKIEEEILIVPGGREAAFKRCDVAWVEHWNNDHVKVGRPWGGKCCINMAIDAVLGIEKPTTEDLSGE